MTYREKLRMDHPEKIDGSCWGGCAGCPGNYYPGAPTDDGNCGQTWGECAHCWNKECPDTPQEAPSTAENALKVMLDPGAQCGRRT